MWHCGGAREHPAGVANLDFDFAPRLRRRRPQPRDIWALDAVFVCIWDILHYLSRAMDKQGVVPDTLVQNRHHRLLRASAAEKSEGVPRQTARDTRCLGPREQPIQHLN